MSIGLTGAGGAILVIPLLIFGTHLGVAEAGSIGLLAVGMAAMLGAALCLKSGTVRYRAALHPPNSANDQSTHAVVARVAEE